MSKGRKRGVAPRRLGVEGLERRELLAGDILVSLSNGNLRITGDGGDNSITIFQQANGRFDIEGLDGEEFNTPNLTNLVVRNITVNLGGGDDTLVIAAQPDPEVPDLVLPASVLGTTIVNGGSGSDTISVSVVGRALGTIVLPALSISIDAGGGSGLQDDTVLLTNSSAGLVTVRTGAGSDTLDLINVLALNFNVDAGVAATSNGQLDNDVVNIAAVTALNATVNLGTGDNVDGNLLNIDTGLFGTLTVNGGNGIDAVTIANTLAGISLNASTLGGNDIVTLDTVQTGLTRADYLDLANLVIEAFGINVNTLPFNLFTLISRLPSFPGSMTISTGAGDDIVNANDLFSTLAIYIYLDNGNDQLVATTVESRIAFFFGGLGTDGRLLTDIDASLSALDLLFETTVEDDQGDLEE